MAQIKMISNQVDAYKNPSPLPVWWPLATVFAIVVLVAGLIFSALSSPDSATNALPEFATNGSSTASVEVDLPAVTPGADPAAEPATGPVITQEPATAPTTQSQPSVTVAVGAPRVITRETSVLPSALFNDGNVVEIAAADGQSVVTIPRNVLATATAGMWATVDPAVALSLPVSGGGGRNVPSENAPNASLKEIALVSASVSSYVFTGVLDSDANGVAPAQKVTVTVLDTPDGFLIQEAG
jgi:hypothetical protein